MDSNFETFVDSWRGGVMMAAQLTLLVGALLGAYYLLGLVSKKNGPDRYKFVSLKEIKFLWYVSLSWTLSLALFLNVLIVRNHSGFGIFEFMVKSFISVAVGFLIGYIMRTYLNTYYPFTLEKRLSAIRFKTRISPKTGKEMRLLNEDEEDEYLTQQMRDEETALAFDYDVWLDEESGDKIIEKYEGNLHLLVCDNCRFRTLKNYKEEVEREATSASPGLVRRYFECSHCGYSEEREVEVASLSGTQQAS